MLTEDELATVVGMTEAQARVRIAQLGNQGEIEVHVVHVEPATCKPATVCRTEKADGIQLFVNAP